MRQLTEQEEKANLEAWMNYDFSGRRDGAPAEIWAFEAGFIAGLEYRQAELEALIKRLVEMPDLHDSPYGQRSPELTRVLVDCRKVNK